MDWQTDGQISFNQVEISTPLLTFPCFSGQYHYAVKNNPDTSGYFHVNFIPSLIALLITQRTHQEYSSVNNINDIYSSIDFKHGFVTIFGRMFYIH